MPPSGGTTGTGAKPTASLRGRAAGTTDVAVNRRIGAIAAGKREPGRLHRAKPGEGGYGANPLADGSLEGYQVFEVAMTSMTLLAPPSTRGSPRRKPSAARTCSRSGSSRGCTAVPQTSPSSGSSNGSPAASPSCWTQTCRRSRPATTSVRPPSCSRTTTRCGRRPPSRHVPQHHGRDRTCVGPLSRPACAAVCRSSTRAIRSRWPRAAARVVEAEELRRADAPGRGRDRGRRHGPRRVVRGAAGGHRDERPRPGPQAGDDRPGARARAPDDRRGRHALRSVHRHADQDGADRPVRRAVRPARRVADARRRWPHAGLMLRDGAEGGLLALR